MNHSAEFYIPSVALRRDFPMSGNMPYHNNWATRGSINTNSAVHLIQALLIQKSC